MFSVILYNWYDDEGVLHNQANEERQVMVIPFTGDNKPCMVNPSFKEDMGKAPSFDFTVNPGMPYYNAYRPLKTLIRIDYNNTDDPSTWKTIFFGRVVTVNTSSLRQVKSIHAEGMYTAFADTVQEGIEEDFQIKKTAYQLYQEIIATHNSQVGDEWWKKVSLDEAVCNVDTDAESKKRDSSSWQTTQNALNQLVSSNGGYMRIRVAHDARDGIPFKLDWYKKYYRDLDKDIGPGHRPCFELAKNILDLSTSQTLSELFTRVIPIGHKANASGSSTSGSEYSSSAQKKESSMIYLPGRVINVESLASGLTDEELTERFQSRDEFANAYNYYGNIYKTVNFPNAYNADLLSSYAHDWIKKNYYGAIKAFTVKAVDMKMVGETDNTDDIIMAGDCVDIIYPIYDQNGNRTLSTKRRLVCKSVQINLYNPEQNTYSIGIPNDAIDFEYGEKKKTGRASTTAAAASSPERPGPGTKQYDLSFDKAARYLYWFYYSNNWGSIEVAQKNNAYSWRTGGRGLENFINLQDRKPHNTFTTYGMPKRVSFDYEDVTITEYDPAHPQDPDYVIGTKTERQRVERVEFLHVLINGITKPVRVMGHYWTSPLQLITEGEDAGKYFYSDVTPKPAAVKNGYHYGFGWVENTDDCLAFSWSEYLNKQYNIQYGSTPQQPIDAFFHFPNVFGRYVEQSGLNSADSSDSSDTGGNAGGKTDSDGSITYYDENGQPSAKIFPDSGRASYGPAIEHYDPETGEVVEPDPVTGEYPENTMTRQMRDPETGTPIFFTTINTPLYDSEGNVIVEAGGISTTDIQLPGIASFKTEIAVINNLIAEKATIGELRAFTAMFGDAVPHDKIDPETGETVIDPTTGKPVQTYDGTQMDITAKGILGVSGLFAKNPDGTIKTGTGGVILVNKNGTEVGLWDKGELSAGMFTERDANGTLTGIVGDRVVVGETPDHTRLTAEDIADWAKAPTAANNKGLFSKFITAKTIRVGEIEATDDDVDIIGNLRVQGGASVEKLLYVGKYSTGSYSLISGTNVTSNMFNVRSNGTLHFNGPSVDDQVNIGYNDAYGLIDSQSHVVIKQDENTDEYVLWYLPPKVIRAGANRDPAEGNAWVKASTFRKAASSSSETYLYGSWSSGVPSMFTAYTTNGPDRYGTHIKEFNIVFDNQSAQAYDHLTVNHGSITINANNTIDIPITVDSVEYSDGGADDDQYITRYSKTITGIDVSSVVASVGVKYLGSYTPSGASESIHAVVPTTDSRKYNYIEISVDEGSLANEGTVNGYRRVKVNAAGNGQATPTAIQEWRITDYGDGYSAVTVNRVAIADNLGIITDDALRPINISIRGTASNTKSLDATFHLGFGTAGTHRVVNLLQADPDVPTTNYVIGRINVDSVYNDGVQSVGVKYLGSYTPSGASESIHAVVPTTDSGKYNYIEISVDEGSLVNEGTTSGYRRVKVNAAGNGQAIPTAIKEWRINDYGTGYSAVTVTRVAIADNLGVITDNTLRPTNISIRGTASNTKSLDATFHLGLGTAGTHRVVNLLQADPDAPTTNYVIGRINVDSVYNAGAQSVGVKYLGSYTPSGASESIHAVVPTTDSGKYNYIEISVDEGSLVNEGTTSGYRRVKVNASGNGQTTPTAIKEWRITDYGDGYSAVTVTSIGLVDGINPLGDTGTRTSIRIQATASNGAKKDDTIFTLAHPTTKVNGHYVVNLRQGSDIIGRINTDTAYNAGFDAVAAPSFDQWTSTNVITDTTSNTIRFKTDDKINGTTKTRYGSRNIYLTVDSGWSGSSTKTKKVYVRDNTASGAKVCQLTITAPTSGIYTGIEANSSSGKVVASETSSTTELSITVVKPTLTYDSASHRYTATATAKAGSVTMDTKTSDASSNEAYNDGWDYGAGTAFSTGATKISSPTSSQISSATQLDADAYYTINIKGKNHSNSNVNGTNLIVKTPAAPQIQITDRWADGTYTVKNGSTNLASTTLSSQMTASGNPTQCTASGATSSTGKYVKQNYIINYEDGNDATSTGKIVTTIVNASSVFDAGFNSARLTETWTNGSGSTAAQLVIGKTGSTSGSYTFPKTHNFTVRFNDLVNTGTSSGRRTVSILSDGIEIYTSSYLQDYGIGYSTGRTDYEPDDISQSGSTITVLNAAGNSVGTFTVTLDTVVPWLGYASSTDISHWTEGSLQADTYYRIYDQSTGDTIQNSSSRYAVWKTPSPWLDVSTNGSGWDPNVCGVVPFKTDSTADQYLAVVDQNKNNQTIGVSGIAAKWKMQPGYADIEFTQNGASATVKVIGTDGSTLATRTFSLSNVHTRSVEMTNFSDTPVQIDGVNNWRYVTTQYYDWHNGKTLWY